ncbi:hypothetical protein Save01_06787 [Streptomyces avermitilis]
MRDRYEDHEQSVIFERNVLVRFTRASRTAAIALAALAALAALLAPTTAHAAPADHPQRHAPGDTITLPVRDALQGLTVQDESRTGYEPSKFKHWTDADKDNCNTRAEVLLTEAVTAPLQGPNCTLTGGNWYSPYDDQYLDSAKKLDVDHLVPLAEAWDSGAAAWTPKEREAYAKRLLTSPQQAVPSEPWACSCTRRPGPPHGRNTEGAPGEPGFRCRQ